MIDREPRALLRACMATAPRAAPAQRTSWPLAATPWLHPVAHMRMPLLSLIPQTP